MNQFQLDGRVAIVTGACGLIGKEHCHALSEAGAIVVAADLNFNVVQEFASTLPNAIGLELDVTKKDSIERLRDSVLERYGHIDILVNNAAINDMFEQAEQAGKLSQFEHFPLDSWKKSFDVNVTGTFLCSQVLGTVMATAGSGSIINIASTYGIVGPDQSLYRKPDGTQEFFKSPAYPTTKGAIVNFTRYLAAYWGHCGVRVNTLSPGGVENSQDGWFIESYAKRTPLQRMAKPTDYKGAIVFLASDASSYMTGANLVVDGGWTAC